MKHFLVTVALSLCFIFSFIAAQPVFAVLPQPQTQADTSVNCPEGYFRKITSNSLSSHNGKCYSLIKPEYGFQPAEFPNITNVVNISCSPDALQTAIQQAPSTGRIINLPSCTMQMGSSQISVTKSNIVIQGQGIGRTILNATGRDGAFQTLFDIHDNANIIVRDMSITGNNKEVIGLNFSRTSNALAERIHFRNGRIAVRFPQSRKVTARYIDSYYTSYHGVAAKECSETDAICPVRSKDVSVYSNTLGGGGQITGNTGNGIDLHSQSGEVAGNYSYKNGQANKFPDASNMYVHNNVFEENTQSGWAIRTYSIIQDYVENLYFFNNTFRNNEGSDVVVVFTGPNGHIRDSIYMIQNNYEGTDAQKNNRSAATGIGFHVCEGTQDYHRTPSAYRRLVTGSICNLGQQVVEYSGTPPMSPSPVPSPSPIPDPTPDPTPDSTPDPTPPPVTPDPTPDPTPNPTPNPNEWCTWPLEQRVNITRDTENRIDIFDYNLLVGAFGTITSQGNPYPFADINCSGQVDIFDYNLLVGAF